MVQFVSNIKSLFDTFEINQAFSMPLLVQKVLIRDTKAAEQETNAPIQVALAISATADHIEAQIVRWELDLTLSQLDLVSFKTLLDHKDAFGSRYPDLKSTRM